MPFVNPITQRSRIYRYKMVRNLKVIFFISFILCSCNKLVQVPEPISTITTSETFGNIKNAMSAIKGIYSDMSWGGNRACFSNGGITIAGGLSSDELSDFNGGNPFETYNLQPDDGTVEGNLWSAAYFDIYMSNVAIEGLQLSSLPQSSKDNLTGEAKFIRAFCHFYLVNLFGNIPLVTSSSWKTSSLLSRTTIDKVYQQIITDLKDAQNLLPSDYSSSGGNRIRANKWAATALLARVYLYLGKWSDAENQASTVIQNSDMYSLASDLKDVFLENSSEAILQLEIIDSDPWSTQEGQLFIPYDATSSPTYYLTPELLGAFEPNDTRRIKWVDSTDYSGTYYYYPSKYKIRQGTSGNIPEAYMILRLSEQYLIRAEARAQQNQNLNGAIEDLDTIRTRANLPKLDPSLTKDQIISAVLQERRIELFAEWGHRWLDLKRMGLASSTLQFKQGWTENAQLYPIPQSELKSDPNLTQNPGYN